MRFLLRAYCVMNSGVHLIPAFIEIKNPFCEEGINYRRLASKKFCWTVGRLWFFQELEVFKVVWIGAGFRRIGFGFTLDTGFRIWFFGLLDT
jgi:hypothetical protein